MKNEIVKKIKSESERLNLHFNQVLIMIAYERAIPRLVSIKELEQNIIFKGGMVMRIVYGSDRYTADLDASFEKLSQAKLKEGVEAAMQLSLDDSFSFTDGEWSKITEQKEYSGLRYSTNVYFDGTKIQRVQFDFSVSEIDDSFVKKNIKLTLENEKVACNVYSIEQILAEKLDAMVSRAGASTRSKDMYDINLLLKQKVNPGRLKSRVDSVFKVRGTEVPQSFQKFFEDLNAKTLENSWSRVQKFMTEKLSFADVLAAFKQNMAELDSLLSKA